MINRITENEWSVWLVREAGLKKDAEEWARVAAKAFEDAKHAAQKALRADAEWKTAAADAEWEAVDATKAKWEAADAEWKAAASRREAADAEWRTALARARAADAEATKAVDSLPSSNG